MLVVLRVNDPPYLWGIFFGTRLYYYYCHLLRRTLILLITICSNKRSSKERIMLLFYCYFFRIKSDNYRTWYEEGTPKI